MSTSFQYLKTKAIYNSDMTLSLLSTPSCKIATVWPLRPSILQLTDINQFFFTQNLISSQDFLLGNKHTEITGSVMEE